MTPLFKKLNLKEQQEIIVLNPPPSFKSELKALKGIQVLGDLKGLKQLEFALAFVSKQKELDTLAQSLAKKAKGDAILWFAYPKGTSKNFTCEFNRDTGWEILGKLGFEGVRQVAIDQDWSALRFRRLEFINILTRDPKRSLTLKAAKKYK